MRAVILDDEDNCIEVLQYELGRLKNKEIEVVKTFNDAEVALLEIPALNFDILFLDIEMPRLNAFQLLDKIESINFQIIFTTAYDHYALKAFRYYAVDYLLKPIDRSKLEEALFRIAEYQRRWQKEMLSEIHSKISSPNTVFSKIALPTFSGFEFVNIEEIIRCEAASNYAEIFLINGSKITISKPLKYLQEILDKHGFFRTHQSHLINLSHIRKYNRSDGGYIVMVDNSIANLSKTFKGRFEEILK